jgi:hypothetical protein
VLSQKLDQNRPDNHLAGLLAAVRGGGVKVKVRTHFDPREAETKYSGIDLHSNNSVVVVRTSWIECCIRGGCRTGWKRLAALAPHREELAGVVVESTYNWYWLVDGLQEGGYQVLLANTGTDGLKHSGT